MQSDPTDGQDSTRSIRIDTAILLFMQAITPILLGFSFCLSSWRTTHWGTRPGEDGLWGRVRPGNSGRSPTTDRRR